LRLAQRQAHDSRDEDDWNDVGTLVLLQRQRRFELLVRARSMRLLGLRRRSRCRWRRRGETWPAFSARTGAVCEGVGDAEPDEDEHKQGKKPGPEAAPR